MSYTTGAAHSEMLAAQQVSVKYSVAFSEELSPLFRGILRLSTTRRLGCLEVGGLGGGIAANVTCGELM